MINAETNQPIAGYDPIASGANINLATLPTRNVNVRANTSPAAVGSVRFGWDGNANYRTDDAAPQRPNVAVAAGHTWPSGSLSADPGPD